MVTESGTDDVLIGTPTAASNCIGITFPEQGVFTVTVTIKSNKTEEWDICNIQFHGFLTMSAYGTKVVAVLDTQSAFGVTIKNMRDQINTFSAGQVAVSVVQPQNPVKDKLWFDKVAIGQMKIYIYDGNSSQWVEI